MRWRLTGRIFIFSAFFVMWEIPSLEVEAKSLIEQIGWRGASGRIMLSVAIAVAAIIFTLIILHLRTQLKIKHDREEASNKLFNDYAYKADLHPSEIKLLRKLLSYEVIPHPHTIFQSASLFERCIDAEVRLLLLTKGDPDSVQDEEVLLSNIRKKLGYGYLPLEHPLISTRNIEIGQVMTIFGTTGSSPLIQHAVLTKKKETFFRVQFNPESEEPVDFYVGQEVRLAFARQGDGVYGVETEICRIDSPSSFDCLHTLNFRRNQMRQHVRIAVDLPIHIRVVKPEEEESFKETALHVDAKLVDISGGGLSFLFERPFVPGDVLSMRFSLTTGTFSDITGKVLRVSLQEGKSATWYRHHVQFLSIDQRHRDLIVKYIFEKQRLQNQLR